MNRTKIKDILLVVHPYFLLTLLSHPYTGKTEPALNPIYIKNKPFVNNQTIDWNRYRKAMFDVYGRFVKRYSNRDDVLVVFIVSPSVLQLENKFGTKHSERFLNFVSNNSKNLIVVKSDSIANVADEIVQKIRSNYSLSREAKIIAVGEISEACVSSACREIANKLGIKSEQRVVLRELCGDILENVPKRRIKRHTVPERGKRRFRPR